MSAGGRSRRGAWRAGLAAAAALAVVYVAAPRHTLYDSRFALLTSEALLTRGSWDLRPLLHEELVDSLRHAEGRGFLRHLWQLEALPDGRVIYRYPPGTSLFSLPLVAVARPLGGTTLGPDGRYSKRRETWLQGLLASLVAAATALAVHRLALRELPLAPATAVALVAGLGGPLWSTASRTLWSHTWTALWVALALLELLRWEAGERRRPVLLALLAGAAFWARPTAALVAAPIALFVALRHRVALGRLVATGGAALLSYVVVNKVVWSSWAPAYTQVLQRWVAKEPWRVVPDLLFSLRGGLLVYSPILVAVAATLVARGVGRDRRPFAALVLAIVAAHFALYTFWSFRIEGTMGLRFLTELTAGFAWLGAHAWRRARDAAAERPRSPAPAVARRVVVRSAVAFLAVASVAAHATGALVLRWPNLYATIRQERLAAERGGPPGSTRPVDATAELPQRRLVRWLVTEWWPGPPPPPPPRP